MENSVKNSNNNEEERILDRIKKYAATKNTFRLNPEDKTVARVMKGLVSRKKKYGYEYCPCRLVSGDKDEDAKIICPCVYHEDEVNADGKCHCDLFVSAE